jgi:hypothetical protein
MHCKLDSDCTGILLLSRCQIRSTNIEARNKSKTCLEHLMALPLSADTQWLKLVCLRGCRCRRQSAETVSRKSKGYTGFVQRPD